MRGGCSLFHRYWLAGGRRVVSCTTALWLCPSGQLTQNLLFNTLLPPHLSVPGMVCQEQSRNSAQLHPREERATRRSVSTTKDWDCSCLSWRPSPPCR